MDLDPSQALALLEWYRALGVDEAIGDAAVDRFAREPSEPAADPANEKTQLENGQRERLRQPPAATFLNAPGPASETALEAATDDVMAAREVARKASTLAELRDLLAAFEGCGLKTTAKRLCLSRGSPKARAMFIGEAPGKDEDSQGIPFVGRAGQLLDRMLASINLGEEDYYITNLVFWRPPGNRTPSPQEVQVCQPFLERQIELVSPEIIVFLGAAAAKQLTGATEGIIKLRGKWMSYATSSLAVEGRSIRAIATLHPAYLLRNPIAKRLAWRDLLAIREALDAS